MKQKYLFVFVGIFAVANAASIYQQKRSADIPVKIVYDKPTEAGLASLRNLEAKPQVAAEEIKPENAPQQLETGVKNLEAKPQLSTADQLDAVKNLPLVADEANKVKIVTPDEQVEIIKPVLPADSVAAAYQEQNIEDIYDKIQEIINNGAKKIQSDFEKIPTDAQVAPQKEEILQKVNATLEEFLESTKKLIELRGVNQLKQDAGATTASPIPNPANIFQQILNSFQSFSSNLFSGINPGQQSTVLSEGTTAAPSGPFPFPNPVEVAQNVFGQLQNNLGSLFGARPPQNAQSDENAPAPATNQNPLQVLQQTFNNIFNRPTAAPGALGDEQTAAPANPVIGFVQNAIQNVQNAFQPSTAAPAQLDEVTQGTTPGGPLTFFQNAGQNVINALQNNPLFPGSSTTAAAQALAQGTTSNPLAAGQNALNQIAPQLSGQIPNNPLQQQGQQALASGANQANQIVAGLTQQGVPVPDQVNAAINTSQQIASSNPEKPGEPAPVVAAPETSSVAPAADAPLADDLTDALDEVKAEADIEEPVKENEKVLDKVEAPLKEESAPIESVAEPIKVEISNELTANQEDKKEVRPEVSA